VNLLRETAIGEILRFGIYIFFYYNDEIYIISTPQNLINKQNSFYPRKLKFTKALLKLHFPDRCKRKESCGVKIPNFSAAIIFT